jgi:hypothetical protein
VFGVRRSSAASPKIALSAPICFRRENRAPSEVRTDLARAGKTPEQIAAALNTA